MRSLGLKHRRGRGRDAALRSARRCIVLLLALLSFLSKIWCITHVPLGTVIENVEMPTVAGGRQELLSKAAANVIMFFKPGQENSRDALKQLAAVQTEFAGKPVHWVAVMSDRADKTDALTDMKQTSMSVPVLIDVDDALYGKLGVSLEPVTVITGHDHKVTAYQPFTRVNYAQVIRAQIRHVLKEISDEELQAVLNPPAVVDSGGAATAARRLKLAQELFDAKRYDKALENVNISIDKDPNVAAAHALRGNILAAQGRCPDAIKAFERALKLDPQHARALEGIRKCQ